jgi:hypothetical protein
MRTARSFITGSMVLLVVVGCTGEAPEKSTVDNSPPSIRSVEITPERPYSRTQLGVAVKAHDPEGNPIQYRYQWMRNDRDIAGAHAKILASEHFGKGDSISVRVTPSDGKLKGNEVTSRRVRILSSPPRVTRVAMDPELPRKNSTLKARVEASDPDGDTIAYSYKWSKNGNVLIGESSETLKDPTLKKGDRIILRVTPYDTEATGEKVASQGIVILNSAPVITSSPHAQRLKSGHYRYQVVAEDPDGDPITFSLSPASPQGMTIDPRTGLIQWSIDRNYSGTFTIEIIASDGDEGKCTQKYNLAIRKPKS